MRLQSPAPTLPELLRPPAAGVGSPALGPTGRKDAPDAPNEDFSRQFEQDGGFEPSPSTGNQEADRLVEAASSPIEDGPEDTPAREGAVSADDSQDLPRRDRSAAVPAAGIQLAASPAAVAAVASGYTAAARGEIGPEESIVIVERRN